MRFEQVDVVGDVGEGVSKGLDLGVESVPEDVGLGVEVAEEGAAADACFGGDVVDGCFVEADVAEEAQRDELEFAGARRRWSPSPRSGRIQHLRIPCLWQ